VPYLKSTNGGKTFLYFNGNKFGLLGNSFLLLGFSKIFENQESIMVTIDYSLF
jgi:hypothetical protein